MKKIVQYFATVFLMIGLMLITVKSYAQDDFLQGCKIDSLEKVNTTTSEICPVVIDGKLYYASIKDEYIGDMKLLKNNRAFYNVFEADIDEEGVATSDRTIALGFNDDCHIGPIAYCEKTGELLATRSNILNPKKDKRIITTLNYRLQIIRMEKRGDTWHLKRILPFNNNNYHVAHPAISPSGDTLVFASDMKANRKKGVDSSISNAGKSDLFMSIKNSNGKWSTPVNLGAVINTEGNEMFPTFLPDGKLCFSSDGREDRVGRLDIYYVNFPDLSQVYHLENDINSEYDDFHLTMNEDMQRGYFTSERGGNDNIYTLKSSTVHIKGIVVDAVDGTPIAGAKVKINDCNLSKDLEPYTSNSEGKFELTIQDNNCLNALTTKSRYAPTEKDISNKTSVRIEMQPNNYEVVVLDADTKEPIPAAGFNCDNEVLWNTNAMGLISINAKEDVSCPLQIKANGYLNKRFSILDNVFDGDMHRDTVYLYKKEVNKTFVLDNIYYDFNKWDILSESEIELDKLGAILEDNPELQVELGSHTDSRGTHAYNRRLSQKRSDSAVNYIISKGIARSRITAKGYGETQLVNRCSNGVKCSESEHRKNRRTEFKILKY